MVSVDRSALAGLRKLFAVSVYLFFYLRRLIFFISSSGSHCLRPCWRCGSERRSTTGRLGGLSEGRAVWCCARWSREAAGCAGRTSSSAVWPAWHLARTCPSSAVQFIKSSFYLTITL